MIVLFAAGTFLHYVFGIAMFLVSVFLILLVLVQRGRGGGLTGALGGMGGQSAFGAKAGDVFTRVTMATAGTWIALCMGSIWLLNAQDEWQGTDNPNSEFSSPDSGGDQETPQGAGASLRLPCCIPFCHASPSPVLPTTSSSHRRREEPLEGGGRLLIEP
jgi:protein translocase SecG subunit